MSIVIRHKQALEDLDYIERQYGGIDGKDDHLKEDVERLLRNPSRSVAFEIVYGQLVILFKKGYLVRTITLGGSVIESLPLDDPKIEEIQERWDLPEPPKAK